jgi:hypothetical protein
MRDIRSRTAHTVQVTSEPHEPSNKNTPQLSFEAWIVNQVIYLVLAIKAWNKIQARVRRWWRKWKSFQVSVEKHGRHFWKIRIKLKK